MPVLGLLEYPHYHSDRYSLIVSISWSTLLAAWLANPKVRGFFRYLVFSLSIVLITTLGLLSFKQTRVWNNSVTLFEHMLEVLDDDPYRLDIHCRLGVALNQKGDTARAIENFKQTLRIMPNHPIALYNIAVAYFKSDKHDLAIQYFNRLLRIDPDHDGANYYIGVLLGQQGKFDQAIKHFNRTLRTRPDLYKTYANLGIAYAKRGDYDMAIQNFNKALQLNPDDPDIRKMLEAVLKKKAKRE